MHYCNNLQFRASRQYLNMLLFPLPHFRSGVQHEEGEDYQGTNSVNGRKGKSDGLGWSPQLIIKGGGRAADVMSSVLLLLRYYKSHIRHLCRRERTSHT